ncbi:metallophosphoesterase family protein [Arcicella sp. LKC2W]|uniref:purple acid phosphatase family protein n=1 Tax=Arcicella sp. LKC2W TaxID=2984198 RepID=UPI002B21B9BC|nr:metallophosphoesterase family protein [Arcicella sp. LKC2W]MEA5458616.1 metallophosphoesterase family protein [Arcicella sp. LKC2W]
MMKYNVLSIKYFFVIMMFTTQAFTQKIVRGPYLQMATPTSMMIRWRTDLATSSKINFGNNTNSLNLSISDNSLKTEHQITLDKLKPSTKYFYNIEGNNGVLQGDADNFFISSPPVGSGQTVKIWALGDMGMGTETQSKVYQQYLKFAGNNYTNIWLLLGDNAYAQGYDWEYQQRFFEYYQTERLMKQTVIFPSPGNHDYTPTTNRVIEDPILDYFKIFTMPTNGEIGGVPSKSKAYYSYNYANIHFVSLDSYGIEALDKYLYSPDSKQMKWLEEDLKANKQKWTIVYWHHPPYTMGSHNSDTEIDLKTIRETVVPILEKYKVDLVLNGHSHNYERSQKIKGHYGLENTYNPKVHGFSSSNGRYDNSPNSCPYITDSKSPESQGIIYVVNGCGAANGGIQSTFPHDAMVYSNNKDGGSLFLEVSENRLEANFIAADGSIKDQFSIFKDVNRKTELKFEANQKSVILPASWAGTYNWQHDNSKNEVAVVTPSVTTKYIVQDDQKCLQDEFTVKVATTYKLQDFNLTVTKSGLAIDWLTTQERGIVHFEIQKKSQGGDFKTITVIPTKAKNQFSDKNIFYRYLDYVKSEEQSVNYRIKTTDNEGVSYYSNVKSVNTVLNIKD